MSCSQFNQLIDHGNYPKLQDYLDSEFGETSSFATITQKRTSACTSGHVSGAADGTPGDPEDVILQIRGSAPHLQRRRATVARARDRQRAAAALARRHDRRLRQPLVDQTRTRQARTAPNALSPANIYPLDGQPLRAGLRPRAPRRRQLVRRRRDPARSTTTPNWRGMMVSLGGIDKMGHMWGPEDRGEKGAEPGSVEEMRHMPFVAKNADAQVGQDRGRAEARGACSTRP